MRPIGRINMSAQSKKLSRGEATRRRIVSQSAPVFNRNGYAGTSLAELMDATGLEKGGIYRHFSSKEELAAAAFDYAWEAVSETRWHGVDDCPAALDKLKLLVQNFVNLPLKTIPGGCPLLNTATDSDDGNPRLRAKAHAALLAWRSRIVAIVCQGQAHGELRSDIDPEQVATVLIAGLEGAVMMARMEKSRAPLARVAQHLEHYLHALR
jgi:TetR/AcrR family transcriptional regulator, transcriptional repressor for nem operon